MGPLARLPGAPAPEVADWLAGADVFDFGAPDHVQNPEPPHPVAQMDFTPLNDTPVLSRCPARLPSHGQQIVTVTRAYFAFGFKHHNRPAPRITLVIDRPETTVPVSDLAMALGLNHAKPQDTHR